MRTQEVIVNHPEGNSVYDTDFRAITVGDAVGFLKLIKGHVHGKDTGILQYHS